VPASSVVPCLRRTCALRLHCWSKMTVEDKEDAEDSEELSEVEQLRMQIAQLHQVCVDTREELLTHRQVLQECLEMREGVQEILEHRETFKQCIAMEDSIKAVMNGAKVMGEIGERQLELDLSLAGVSDNTARHGRAIGTIAEQQKRSGATLDAVVRAVKRLARSRSRGRGPLVPPSTENLLGATGMDEQCDADQLFSTRSAAAPTLAYLPPVLQDGPISSSCERRAKGTGSGNRKEEDDFLGPAAQPHEWLEGGQLEQSQPRLLEAVEDPWQGLVQELTGRYGASAQDGDWIGAPGWPPLGTAGLEADVLEGLQGFCGVGVTSEEEPRYWSGSSSCGSESRALRAPIQSLHHPRGSSRSGSRVGGSYRSGAGIPDTCLGGPGDPGKIGGPASNAPIASPEMANCVQGVLARIEEALTKLDGSVPHEADGISAGSARRHRSSNGVPCDAGRNGRRPTQRPNSARGTAATRNNGTPRATTPRGGRP